MEWNGERTEWKGGGTRISKQIELVIIFGYCRVCMFCRNGMNIHTNILQLCH